MKTGPITYNVTKRGRKFRGQERNFDPVSLAAVINGPEVQEKVKNRDRWGYYGHFGRMLFGMEPGEGGVVPSGPFAGKLVRLEPAFITTAISADNSGNITHEAEFLDNANGRLAKRAFNNRVGGFSSAIDARPMNGKDIARGFYGFDYVSEPNFTGNRGFALDGVEAEAEAGMLLDSAVLEGQQTIAILDGLYTRLQGDYDRLAESLAHAQHVNNGLVAMIASGLKPDGGDEPLKPLKRDARLDSAAMPQSRLMQLAREWNGVPLETLRSGEQQGPDKGPLGRLLGVLQIGR